MGILAMFSKLEISGIGLRKGGGAVILRTRTFPTTTLSLSYLFTCSLRPATYP